MDDCEPKWPGLGASPWLLIEVLKIFTAEKEYLMEY